MNHYILIFYFFPIFGFPIIFLPAIHPSSNRIDTILKPDGIAVLFIREDHRVQFPTDIQIFYIAPPSLESLKQWLDDQFKKSTDSDAASGKTS